MNSKALIVATLVGLVLQLAMVIGGHVSPGIKDLFAVGGMGFSLIAGLVFAYIARGGWSPDIIGGAIAGGLCAIIGIAVSVMLGDVPASLLLLGTISSIVTGLIGGGAGKLLFG
jgi:hypothetical protein